MLIVSLALLAVVLAFALVRPKGWTEDIAALPAATAVIVIGALPLRDAVDEVTRLLPVVGFLAAVLVLAQLCAEEGVFQAAGGMMARGSAGRPKRLLRQVFIIASVTTAVLSLDATVVLLTPVVLATARTLRLPDRPHTYASAHLANTASLLLPVSNLTNLLAFASAGLSFTRFTALMAGPWLLAIAAEYVVFRWFFAGELSTDADDDDVPATPAATGVRAGGARTHAGGLRGHIAGRPLPGVGCVRGCGGAGGAGNGSDGAARSAASCGRSTCRSSPSCWRFQWWCDRRW